MLSFRASAHTGVGIPIDIPKIGGDCHTSDIGHWFAMTAFFVYFALNETAPFAVYLRYFFFRTTMAVRETIASSPIRTGRASSPVGGVAVFLTVRVPFTIRTL